MIVDLEGVAGVAGRIASVCCFRDQEVGFLGVDADSAVKEVLQAIAGTRQIHGVKDDLALRRAHGTGENAGARPDMGWMFGQDGGLGLDGKSRHDGEDSGLGLAPSGWEVQLDRGRALLQGDNIDAAHADEFGQGLCVELPCAHVAGQDAEHHAAWGRGRGEGPPQSHEWAEHDGAAQDKRSEKPRPAPQHQRQEWNKRQARHPARSEEKQGAWPPRIA